MWLEGCNFTSLVKKTLLEKGQNAGNQHFSFSYNVFNHIKDKNRHFKYFYFVVCKCFEFGPV